MAAKTLHVVPMMLPTHVLAGLAVAAAMLGLAPADAPTWLAPVALASAATGSVLPDLDLYAGHRRTLHYPSGYVAGLVPVSLAVFVQPTPVLVALGFVLLGAALHCRMDRYGGGLELRPWEGRSDRAVYDHLRGRWRTPKRWVPYDGAPADLALAGVLGLPLLFVLGDTGRLVVSLALGVAVTYALLRRRLANLAPAVVGFAPDPMTGYVPERYRER